jgi:hypothetical protein
MGLRHPMVSKTTTQEKTEAAKESHALEVTTRIRCAQTFVLE